MTSDSEFKKIDRKLDEIRKKFKGIDDFKIGSEVFDTQTLMTLYYFVRKGYIDLLFGVISTGKEANVFLAKDKTGKNFAVKIQRIGTRDYNSMTKYVKGDPRFKDVKRSKRELIFTWVKKEYKNLQKAKLSGVDCPGPLGYRDNIIILEFLGEGDRGAPMLKNMPMDDPGKVLDIILKDVKRLYCDANLVHGDLSEYNILMLGQKPVIIDMSQSVSLKHPMAMEMLRRDIHNLAKFFGKHMKTDEKKILDYVTGCESKPRQASL